MPAPRTSHPETEQSRGVPVLEENPGLPETLRDAEVESQLPESVALAAASAGEASVHETLVSSQPHPDLIALRATGTQPSMPSFAEPPGSSRDLRRVWHVDEQFHRQDARIRLLEKEIGATRKIALLALAVAVICVAVTLRAWL